MVALPLFKLGALFVRHISKYGANQIKVRAHENVRFRAFAARYGQHIHQLNMRMNVALLRNANPEKEKRAKEKAEAAETPTAKTKEEVEKEERAKAKEEATRAKYGTTAKESHPVSQIINPTASVWRRKFRALPEAKAVALFADVIGDVFILGIASLLVIYEYYKSATKPDTNGERIKELTRQLEELQQAAEENRRQELRSESRILAMESALRGFRDPKTKQPLLAPAPAEPTNEPPAQTSQAA